MPPPCPVDCDALRALAAPLLALVITASCKYPEFEFTPAGADAGGDACADGGCAAPCPPGLGDCNAAPEDGCETTLDSLAHCGDCGQTCSNEHGTTSCKESACVPACAAGYANCDLDPGDGCEANLNADPLNCGACGRACPAKGGTPACTLESAPSRRATKASPTATTSARVTTTSTPMRRTAAAAGTCARRRTGPRAATRAPARSAAV